MDKTELTKKCLEWETCMRQAAALEQEIVPAVLAMQETYKAGNVIAKFRSGAVQNDWETPGRTAPVEIIGKHTTIKSTTSWAKVCAEAQIEPLVLGYGDATVKLEIVDEAGA